VKDALNRFSILLLIFIGLPSPSTLQTHTAAIVIATPSSFQPFQVAVHASLFSTSQASFDVYNIIAIPSQIINIVDLLCLVGKR